LQTEQLVVLVQSWQFGVHGEQEVFAAFNMNPVLQVLQVVPVEHKMQFVKQRLHVVPVEK
jgi:hypothetical protein